MHHMQQVSLPKIAIVGRPNVGKSALFNRLCQKRISIVDEQEGVTRDCLFAEVDWFGQKCQLIDTGGIDATSTHLFNEEVRKQSEWALEMADIAVLVVDGTVGLTDLDYEVAKLIIRRKIPALCAVNKIDGAEQEILLHPFHALPLSQLCGVSAIHGYQIAELIEAVLALLPKQVVPEVPQLIPSLRVTIAGRPNVGKSTLLNRLLGVPRAIVSPIAGTTRDAVDALLSWEDQAILFVDTAGIRRKKVQKERVDQCADLRTREALERSDLVLLMLDAQEGITEQEKRIASAIEALGKSCILLFNKWDLVHGVRMEHLLLATREAVPFLAHCPALFLSAEIGRNVDKVLPLIREVHEERARRIPTGELNAFMERAVQEVHPPMLTGKRLRIYYMVQVQVAPPKFVFFVNRASLMTDSYKKYLINQFRNTYRFLGTPLCFELRNKSHRLH
jgi:GTPase